MQYPWLGAGNCLLIEIGVLGINRRDDRCAINGSVAPAFGGERLDCG